MKTILIPVDFSQASENAIAYTAKFVKYAPVSRIILLKSCYVSIYAQVLPSADYVQLCEDDIKSERASIEQEMHVIGENLQREAGDKVKVEVAITDHALLRAINDITEREQPDLIIAGSDHTDEDNQSYISQQIIKIARTSTKSVLVIPSNYKFQPVKRALLACDFKTILRSNALTALESRYNWLNSELLVLNVSKGSQAEGEQREMVEENLKALLKNYKFEIHYVQDDDILHGIITFADGNNVQMIISLPGSHSFLYQLTHSSISEGLSANANYPLLLLK